MWQRRFLVVTGVIELLILTPAFLFIVLLGFHGFVAGEAGTMIGLFSAAILLFLFPYLAVRLAAVLGLRKNNRWAPALCLILSLLVLASVLFTLTELPALLILLVAYLGLSIWAAVGCLRHYVAESGR